MQVEIQGEYISSKDRLKESDRKMKENENILPDINADLKPVGAGGLDLTLM